MDSQMDLVAQHKLPLAELHVCVYSKHEECVEKQQTLAAAVVEVVEGMEFVVVTALLVVESGVERELAHILTEHVSVSWKSLDLERRIQK